MRRHPERVIGRFTGAYPGPLLIVLGGVHGNEPAGVEALSLIFKMLEIEPVVNPDFRFCGRLVGLRGNIQALEAGSRYIEQDLNRMFTPERIYSLVRKPEAELKAEERELVDLVLTIDEEVTNYMPKEMVLLDLHTTTAYGGIFSISKDDDRSIELAMELHAPVVRGMLQGLQGTTLHFIEHHRFDNIASTGVCFESGQHSEELSVNRAIAGVINCMRTMGCVRHEDVENQHDRLLIEFSKGLPKVTKLVYKHRIEPEDEFQMSDGYKNFQSINKGELLARDKKGDIYAPEGGLILMPLYQRQGEEGFFIVKSV
jgi:succinylglutamate desuccinylase